MERDKNGRYVDGHKSVGGRPPGSLSLLTILKDALVEVPDGEKQTYAEKMIRQYRDITIEKNDGIAVRDMLDRVDGRALQKVVVENEKISEFVELYRGLKDEVVQETEGDIQDVSPDATEDTDT